VENQQAFEQAPTAVIVTVRKPRRRRPPARDARPREYLTEREVERLMKAAGDNSGYELNQRASECDKRHRRF
jgi:hypothetical protein